MEAITHRPDFVLSIFQGFSTVEQTLKNGRWESRLVSNGKVLESWVGLSYPGEEVDSNTYPFVCEECGETFFLDNSHCAEKQAKNHYRACNPLGFLAR